jgi:hypothetical protein
MDLTGDVIAKKCYFSKIDLVGNNDEDLDKDLIGNFNKTSKLK